MLMQWEDVGVSDFRLSIKAMTQLYHTGTTGVLLEHSQRLNNVPEGMGPKLIPHLPMSFIKLY